MTEQGRTPAGTIDEFSQIGRSVKPLGWEERTSGKSVFASDVVLPGMLHAAILRSPHPYASLRSIDASGALAMPGVHAVVSAADIARDTLYIHHGGQLSDRPPFARDVVRFIGQEVAAVAAEELETAREALRAVVVDYRRKRGPTTIEQALRSGSAALHRRAAGHNVSQDDVMAWGPIEDVLADARWRAQGTYHYPQINHASMETHGSVAWWHPEEERLDLWSSTQSPYFVRKEVAAALGLERSQIRFRGAAVGGGFGAKSKITEHEVIAALLSMRSGRPVKLWLTREEEFAATKSRHAFVTSATVTLDENLRLTGIDAELLVDNGAFNHTGPSVMRAGQGMLGLLYRPLAVRAHGRLVDTAKVPGGQFRGYGMPQVAFAVESEIDELAVQAGVDPLELRIRNANNPDETTLSGARVRSAALAGCLAAARDAIGWDEKKRNPVPGRGLGVAVAVHGSGVYSYEYANRGAARVEIDVDGRVRVRFGGSDPGTGQRTLLAQITAEELGISAEDVSVEMMDLSVEPADLGAWSSRGTHFGGNAVWAAARATAEVLREAGREKFGTDQVRLEGGRVCSAEDAISLGDLVAGMPQAADGVLGVEETFEDKTVDPTWKFATSPTANTSPSYAFAVHAVELEVDEETGEVKILDYVAVHDAGRILNPVQAEGQIIGGVVMGVGAALREELLFEGGRVVNPAYLHYGVPRAPDAPPVRVIFVGEPEPAGPFGAKNVGEIAVIPCGPAIANAVRDATGARIRTLPITPDKIVSARMDSRPQLRPVSLWRRPERWWIALMRWAYPRGVEHLLDFYGTRFARRRRRTRVQEVQRPTSLEWLATLAMGQHTPVGGATELQLLRRQGLSDASRLVAVGGVRELTRVTWDDEGNLLVGAAVTLRDLAGQMRQRAPVLTECIETIATPQIRAVATVAGNLLQEKRCWFYRNDFDCYKRSGPASPCYAILGDHRFYHATMDAHRCQAVTPSDLATVLVALDAEVETLRGQVRRTLPMTKLYSGPGEHALGHGEIVTGVRVPAAALRRRGSFRKLQLWAGDFAVTAVALTAQVDDAGSWHDVRLCVGGLAPTPWLAERTAAAAEGRVTSADVLRRAFDAELSRHADPLEHNAWKNHAASALVGRAAEALIAGSGTVDRRVT